MLSPLRSSASTILCLVLLAAFPQIDGFAQQQPAIHWEHGPTIGKLGNIGQITVPKGYQFSGKEGTQALLELTHNPPSGSELGVIVPESTEENWFVTFDFN